VQGRRTAKKRNDLRKETEVGVGESVGFGDLDDHSHQPVLQRLMNAELLLLLLLLVQLLLSAHVELLLHTITSTSTIGSRPSDHYFRSVCWLVCLFVCLCRVFLSRL